MRLPKDVYSSRPWRMHEMAADFDVEDVWQLPVHGTADDLPRVVRTMFDGPPFPEGGPPIVQFLWEARWRIGALLHLDDAAGGLDTRVPSLRKRLPEDLRSTAADPDISTGRFSPIFQTRDEFAAELANRTVHGVLHLGWVPDDADGYSCQLTVLVRPNGWLGSIYLAGIKPFRYLLVYPALLRMFERKWTESARRN